MPAYHKFRIGSLTRVTGSVVKAVGHKGVATMMNNLGGVPDRKVIIVADDAEALTHAWDLLRCGHGRTLDETGVQRVVIFQDSDVEVEQRQG